MRLYIKQKVFSFADKFTVKDENGNDLYYVEGEIFSFGKKLHILDANGNEVALLAQKLLTFLPKFNIYIGGRLAATLVKEFTFFKPKYRLEGTPLRLSGDFWAHDYIMDDGQRTVMTLKKEWFTWGDSYVIDIANPDDALLCLAVVLGVDCAIEMNRSSHHNNN